MLRREVASTAAAHEAFLSAFVGTFALAEPIAEVRVRVHEAIEDSLDGLSWSLRALGRPLLRRAAHVPEWIRFEASFPDLVVCFAGRGRVSEIALSSQLDGERTRQRLMPAVSGEVRHARVNQRTLKTEIFVKTGSITNLYQLVADSVLEGHVTIASELLPRPVRYGMTLRRAEIYAHERV